MSRIAWIVGCLVGSLLPVFTTTRCLAQRLLLPPPPLPSAQTEWRTESQEFAELLQIIVTEIADRYVRPVSQEELLLAGLTALHEAAHLPISPQLAERLRKAVQTQSVLKTLTNLRESLGTLRPLSRNEVLTVCCRGMMRVLDPYCSVVTASEEKAADATEERFGVGIELIPNVGVGLPVIRRVVPGGPAQRAGLQAGDRLTHVAGQRILGQTSTQVQDLLDGASPLNPPSEPPILPRRAPILPRPGLGRLTEENPTPALTVELTVLREGVREPQRMLLVRELHRPEAVLGGMRRQDNSWDYWLDRSRGLALIRLGRLGRGSARDLQEVLDRLTTDGGLRGLVLDLRWCPGGFLNEALCAAGVFLPEGTGLATIKDRQEETRSWKVGDHSLELEYLRSPVSRHVDIPIVALVNGETLGGGELIAAALQDHRRAVVVGQRTRGKASIQITLDLPIPEVRMKLSTGIFLRPKGQNLHRFAESLPGDDWGVRPDSRGEMRLTSGLERHLRNLWEEQTVRPGLSMRPLPLDDPQFDPQIVAGRRRLEEMLRGAPRP